MAKKESCHAELVSVSQNIDAPYELPEGWKWKKMTDVVIWGSGGTPKATEPKYYKNGTIPWLIIADLNDSFVMDSEKKITKLGLDNSSAKMVPKNTLLVAMYGSIGKLGITGIECCTNQAIAFAKELKNTITKYMFYYMASIKPKLIAMGRGGTQQNISQTLLNTLSVPLPPTIDEQQSIVNRIESMFAKLDEAKEKAQNVVDSFETRKAAILHQAFTGNLTAKWRKENGVSDDSWTEKKLEDVCEFITKGTTPKKEDMTIGFGDVPYIKVYNLCFDTSLDFSVDPTFVKKESHENFLARSITLPGDVLMNIVGPPFGKVSIVPDDYPEWNINQAIARFRCKEELLSIYLANYLISPRTIENMSRKMKTTAGQQNLTLEICRNITILVPSIFEQKEIVRILDNVLEKERTAKSTAEQVLEQIDLLKKSILARAFRGKL